MRKFGSRMKAEKISIIGCGWLGLPLAEALLKQGFEVHGSTTSPEKLPILAQKSIIPYLIDLKTLELNPENAAFFGSKILILNVPPGRQNSQQYPALINNLQTVLQNSAVEKVIFISSTGVYQPSLQQITETSLLDHTNSGHLIEAEKSISSPENHWQTTIIRFAGLFGPGRAPGRFLAGKTNLPDSEAPVNLIHLHDCIKIIQEIIGQQQWNEIFNACADQHPSRAVFYTAAARKLNLPEPTFEAGTVGKTSEKLISNQKLKTKLQYQFLFPDPLSAL